MQLRELWAGLGRVSTLSALMVLAIPLFPLQLPHPNTMGTSRELWSWLWIWDLGSCCGDSSLSMECWQFQSWEFDPHPNTHLKSWD